MSIYPVITTSRQSHPLSSDGVMAGLVWSGTL